MVPAWYFADRKCCAGRKPPWEKNVKNSRTSQVNDLGLIFFNGCLIAGLEFKGFEINKYIGVSHTSLYMHSEFNHLHIKSYLRRPSIALEASLMPVSLRTNWSCQRFCTGKMRGMRTWRSCAQPRTIQNPCHGVVSSNVWFHSCSNLSTLLVLRPLLCFDECVYLFSLVSITTFCLGSFIKEKFSTVPWGSMHRQPPGERLAKCCEKNKRPRAFCVLPQGWNTKVQVRGNKRI